MSLDVVITHALRTPMARAGTNLRRVDAVELGRQVVGELIARADIDVAEVDEVVLGCTGNPVDAANVARVVTLRANLPRETPALTVQRNCGSGLEALTTAVEKIQAGRARVMVAGGVESMSNYPLLFSNGARGVFERFYQARNLGQRLAALAGARPRHLRPEISLEIGLVDPVSGLNMGETAEVLAKEFGIAREDQDEYALRSHQRTCDAEKTGRFAVERMPLFLPPAFDEILDVDVGPRPQQSVEALSRLQPVFDGRHGTVPRGTPA